MKHVTLLILAFFLASPAWGQGLTINITQTDATGKKTPVTLLTDRARMRARLDLPAGTKLLYNNKTQKLLVMFAGAPTFVDLTPELIQTRNGQTGRQSLFPLTQPPRTLLTYKRMGQSKVGPWACTVYEGSRGNEKVVELCAADGAAIDLTAADFEVFQQALALVNGTVPQDILDTVPTYGTAATGFVGFPVRRTTFVNGKPDTVDELVDFNRGAIPEANFAVPVEVPPVPPVINAIPGK